MVSNSMPPPLMVAVLSAMVLSVSVRAPPLMNRSAAAALDGIGRAARGADGHGAVDAGGVALDLAVGDGRARPPSWMPPPLVPAELSRNRLFCTTSVPRLF